MRADGSASERLASSVPRLEISNDRFEDRSILVLLHALSVTFQPRRTSMLESVAHHHAIGTGCTRCPGKLSSRV